MNTEDIRNKINILEYIISFCEDAEEKEIKELAESRIAELEDELYKEESTTHD